MKIRAESFPSPAAPREAQGRSGVLGNVAYPTRPPHPNPLLSKERGSTITIVLIALLGTFAVISFLFLSENKPCASFNEASLQTPKQTITLALANTREKQSKGLGGCKYVPENSGMYFGFEQSNTHTFWMKDMIIPIDIIWLREGKVVGIEKNVPNMPLNTPDEGLHRYTSPEPIDAVLEVGAGKAEEYGIEVGSEITLNH